MASYTDLTGNGNNTGPGVAPAWDAVNGWKFDGVTQYLVTTLVPQNDQGQTLIVQFSNISLVLNFGWLAGVREAANQYFGIGLFDFAPGATGINFENGGTAQHNPILTSGNLCVAGDKCYRNGIYEAPDIPAYNGNITEPLFIGAYNNNGGGPLSFLPGNIQALGLFSCILTSSQVGVVRAEMAAI